MITVGRLVTELKKYPQTALVYAYEGEETGIVIVSARKTHGVAQRELGFIQATEFNSPEADESLLVPTKRKRKSGGRKNDRAH